MTIKDTIYICGDSSSHTNKDIDKEWYDLHWSILLSKKFPDKKVVNLAAVGTSNLAIGLMIDVALADPNTFFVIINPTDIFRIDIPTINVTKNIKMPEIDITTNRETYKKWHERLYKKSYINEFIVGEKLLKEISSETHINTYSKESKLKYMTFGPWSFIREPKSPHKRLTAQMMNHMFGYFEHEFDINLKFATEFGLIEGKLFKLHAKGIPFLFNLGGFANPIMTFLYPEVTSVIDEDLKKYYVYTVNLPYISMSDPDELPTYHIPDVDELHRVADEYYKKIVELTNYQPPLT